MHALNSARKYFTQGQHAAGISRGAALSTEARLGLHGRKRISDKSPFNQLLCRITEFTARHRKWRLHVSNIASVFMQLRFVHEIHKLEAKLLKFENDAWLRLQNASR
jgi:hypothetical protein